MGPRSGGWVWKKCPKGHPYVVGANYCYECKRVIPQEPEDEPLESPWIKAERDHTILSKKASE